MLRYPTVHPVNLTVAAAAAAFESSPKTHLLLLVRGAQLVTTVSRADLKGAAPGEPACVLGTLSGRTISPRAPLTRTREAMVAAGLRRLAVVGEAGRLLGLLCLKSSLAGFCTDEGVAAMRQAR
ncbi:CBS domain-containing protein [Frankia sp. R43]|uniref:CBS domain-containing protein n=1 Tax=Frankia sp. R43 TaxID=269536 RepID=UPI00128F6631|nr:CBS domain-containing protein [Frankia sp. R43]